MTFKNLLTVIPYRRYLFLTLWLLSTHILHSQSVVFIGENGSTAPPTSGPGTRWMWYAEKAALRSGQLVNQGANWNKDSIGQASVAFGVDTKAKGINSIAWGEANEAIGMNSSAGGFSSVALGNRSVAIGHDLISSSFSEVVFGLFNKEYNAISATTFNSDDRIFVLGNGSSNSARSNALEVYKNGHFQLNNALAFQPDTVLLTTDDQLLDVTTTSYLRVDSNNNTAPNRTVLLSNGTFSGQMLILECISNQCELKDNVNTGGNINLSIAARPMSPSGVIQLSWTGTQWQEISFTQN